MGYGDDKITIYKSFWRTIEHLEEEIETLKSCIEIEKAGDNDSRLLDDWEEDIKSHKEAIEELKGADLEALKYLCEE